MNARGEEEERERRRAREGKGRAITQPSLYRMSVRNRIVLSLSLARIRVYGRTARSPFELCCRLRSLTEWASCVVTRGGVICCTVMAVYVFCQRAFLDFRIRASGRERLFLFGLESDPFGFRVWNFSFLRLFRSPFLNVVVSPLPVLIYYKYFCSTTKRT